MSRSLGRVALIKKAHKESSYEADGRKLFESGAPCPHNGKSDKGKAHALWRGWQRARMETNKKVKLCSS